MLPDLSVTSPSGWPEALPSRVVEEKEVFEPPSPTVVASDSGSASSITTKSTSSFDAQKSFQLSTFQLLVVHIGAALTLFLATTDATIVSTSLPTISSDLRASEIQYTWVGVAYMLTQTAFQPLYGRVSDLVGRKNVLYSSIAIFALGSALCGAAQLGPLVIPFVFWRYELYTNINCEIAGIGGGGIVSAVWIITAELVEVRQRATWSQALSITWSCSAIAGPLIGGLFSGKRSVINFYLAEAEDMSVFKVETQVLRDGDGDGRVQESIECIMADVERRFDFVGCRVLFMGGTSCIIIGFSFVTQLGSTNDYFSFYFIHYFSPQFCIHRGTFYLALFYQAANGSTPLQSGMKLLPYSLGSSLASMPVAWFIGYCQRRTHDTSGQNRTISIGLFISTLGFGLLNLLNEYASIASQIAYPLVAGIGLGMLFHAPYQVFTRALKREELATGTSAFFLVRFTGATVGLAVAGTIFYAEASTRLPPELKFNDNSSSINYSAIKSLPPVLKEEVLHIISTSIRISFALRRMSSSDVDEPNETHTTSTTQSSAEDEKVEQERHPGTCKNCLQISNDETFQSIGLTELVMLSPHAVSEDNMLFKQFQRCWITKTSTSEAFHRSKNPIIQGHVYYPSVMFLIRHKVRQRLQEPRRSKSGCYSDDAFRRNSNCVRSALRPLNLD
ncbi:major facilitator superfamily domain-containing protein [Flammula alnicola]|nr:major facilitator superfamily domain-containing protein [Flammula alnicola]